MIYSIVVKDSSGINITDVIQITVTDWQETYSAKVVEFVVEKGLPISDNMTLDNDSFSINGVVSNYSDLSREIVLQDDEFVLLNGTGVFEEDYSEIIRSKLIALRNEKQIFSIFRSKDITNYVETLVEEIPNCVLLNVSFKQSKGQSGVIFPDLSIKRLNITSTSVEKVDNMIPRLAVNIKTATTDAGQAANSVSDSEIDKAIADATAKPKPNASLETDPAVKASILKQTDIQLSNIQKINTLKDLQTRFGKVVAVKNGDEVLGYYLGNDNTTLYAADGITVLKK